MPSVVATEPARQIDYWDDGVTGLILRMNPGGTKTFYVWFVNLGKQARRMKLGRYPIVSLADARDRAREALGLVAKGQDPVAEKQKTAVNYLGSLFPAMVSAYIEDHAKPNTKGWREIESSLTRNFVARWSHIAVGEITRQEVQAAVNDIASKKTKSATNHAIADLRAFCNWAVKQGAIAVSPCAGIGLKYTMPSRDRVLTDDELRKIWNAAESMAYPYGHFVRLLILTGQRREEVANLRWAELNQADRIWVIPKERTKAGRQHDVPLSPQVLAILSTIPALNPELVFPARGSNRAISGFSAWKKELDDRSGVHDWRIHDLRRTAASGMARLGVQPHVIGRVLNHASGGLTELQGIYNRHSYLPETRDALTKWAEAVDGIVHPRPKLVGAA